MKLRQKLGEFWKKEALPQASLIISQDFDATKHEITVFLKNILPTNISPENNSDITFIELEKNKTGDLVKHITIDQVRQLRESFSTKSGHGNAKFGIILGADLLNINSSNALLKILEDTPKNSYLLVVANDTHKLIRTILSRLIEIHRDEKLTTQEDSYSFFYRFINPEVRFEDKLPEIDKFLAKSAGSQEDKIEKLVKALASILKFGNPQDPEELELIHYINSKQIDQKSLLEFVDESCKILTNVRLFNLDLRQILLLIIAKFAIL